MKSRWIPILIIAGVAVAMSNSFSFSSWLIDIDHVLLTFDPIKLLLYLVAIVWVAHGIFTLAKMGLTRRRTSALITAVVVPVMTLLAGITIYIMAIPWSIRRATLIQPDRWQ